MPTSATAGSGTTYKPAPSGNHLAICIGVIDLGVQDKVFNGETKPKPCVLLQWELCDERRDDEKLYTLSREFTLSLHENSSLRPFLQSWRGKAFSEAELQRFDVKNLLGVPCMLNVVHETKGDRTYANVASATPLPKRVTAPETESDLRYYDTDAGLPPDDMPAWIKAKIMKCEKFRNLAPAAAPGPDKMPPTQGTGDDFEEWDDDKPRF